MMRYLILLLALFACCYNSAYAIWIVSSHRSPMDEKETLSIYAIAKKDPLRRNTPLLFVQCTSGELSIILNAGVMLTQDNSGNRIFGRIRYDNLPAKDLMGNISSSYKTIFLLDPESHLEYLLKARHALFEFMLFPSGQQIAEFDVAGLDRHLPLLGQHCRLTK